VSNHAWGDCSVRRSKLMTMRIAVENCNKFGALIPVQLLYDWQK
jgi:hypothetical protein